MMKKVTPSQALQIFSSHISTNDVIQSALEAECRFCKKPGNPQNSFGEFLCPCSCLQPIHSYCLADQMQKNTNRDIKSTKSEKNYKCHKCLANIRFLFQTTHQCRSCPEIRQFSRQRKCFCFWQILGIIIMISLLVFVVVMKATSTLIQSITLTNTTIIGVLIVVIVLFLISTFCCVTQVVFEERRKVSLLQTNVQKKRKFSSRLEIVDCT